MTHEQFEEAIKINKRIEQLEKVLKEFERNRSCRLSLITDYSHCIIVPSNVTDLVENKLKNYTEKFIQELNEEIKELNKQIKDL